MARLEIKARARADLDRLARFLWEKGEEEAAVRALEKIVEGIELLTSSGLSCLHRHRALADL